MDSFKTNPYGPTAGWSSTLLTETGVFGSPAPAASSASGMTLGTAATGLMALGVLNSVVGSYFSARQAKAQLRFQADIAETNARLAEMSAQQELLRGQREYGTSRLKTAALKSAQRTAMAANGIDLGSDTALNVLTTTDVMGEIDANTIAANAVRAAWGYRTQGTNMANEALVKRATGDGISPASSATTALVSGAGSVAQSWYRNNRDAKIAATYGIRD